MLCYNCLLFLSWMLACERFREGLQHWLDFLLVQYCMMETVLLGVEAHQKVSCNLKKAFNDGVSMHNVIYFNLFFCICLVLHIKKATWLNDHSYLFQWQFTVFSFLWGCSFPELHNFITIICFLLCYSYSLLLPYVQASLISFATAPPFLYLG